MAGADAGELEAFRRRVEAGMEHGAVALAGAAEDVGASFEQHYPRATHGEPAEDRAANHAGADDRDVIAHGVIYTGRIERCRTACADAKRGAASRRRPIRNLREQRYCAASPTALSSAWIMACRRLTASSVIGGPLKRLLSKAYQMIAMTMIIATIR
jgi:hypothetical protein